MALNGSPGKVFVEARDVALELATDVHKGADGDASALLATMAGTERIHSRILSGVSFRAEEGDRVGIMGLNGAGKTTLLRVLNGAYPPTHGRVESHGSMQSLLNATLGFNEAASVAENVFLRGTAMGLRYRQLREALGPILEFAGLRDRIDQQLHTLSAGQCMRLGFAISTAIQPDILLMDEWMIAGDASFMARAQERMLGRFHESRIVFLASHSTELLKDMCNKALVLDRGKVRHFGGMAEGVEVYCDIVARATEKDRAGVRFEPLLFGDVTGLIERITVGEGEVVIEGWALDDRGGEIGVVCVEVAGQRRIIDAFERIERSDVRLHMAKRSGRYGFRIKVADPQALARRLDPVELARHMQVSVGGSAARLGVPLHLAAGAIVTRGAGPRSGQSS